MTILGKWVEAETGEEIIVFLRRGRPVYMVRDMVTKRFIAGIRGIQLAVSVVFEYPPDKARRDNPLYVDIKASTMVMGFDIYKMDQIIMELYGKCRDIINEYFGPVVSGRGEEEEAEFINGVPPTDKLRVEKCYGGVVGVEYIAFPIEEVYPEYHYWLVWHHYKDDCQEEEGSLSV